MTVKEKIANMFRKTNELKDFSYTNVKFRIIDFKISCKKYTTILGNSKNNIEYQDRIFSKSLIKRDIEDDIIRDIIFLDRFSKKNNLEMLYGKFTEEELKNSNLIINNFCKRKEVLEKCVHIFKNM